MIVEPALISKSKFNGLISYIKENGFVEHNRLKIMFSKWGNSCGLRRNEKPPAAWLLASEAPMILFESPLTIITTSDSTVKN